VAYDVLLFTGPCPWRVGPAPRIWGMETDRYFRCRRHPALFVVVADNQAAAVMKRPRAYRGFNQRPALDAAGASCFHVGDRWRRSSEAGCYVREGSSRVPRIKIGNLRQT